MTLQNREKKFLTALVVVAILAGIALYFIHRPSTAGQFSTNNTIDESATVTPPRQSPPRSGTSTSRSSSPQPSSSTGNVHITLDVFQKNNTLESCWVLIEGTVFNISGFLMQFSEHQTMVLQFCGTTGFEAGFINHDKQLLEIVKEYSLELGTLG